MRNNNITVGFIIIVVLMVSRAGLSMSQDAYAILDSAYNRYGQIIDYTADAEIRIDVDFIRIPDKNVKLYYKKPDKLKYKGAGFFMLPKKGLDFSFYSFLSGEYNAIYTGNESIDSKECYMLKVLPADKKPEIILTDIWIDTKTLQVRKMESFSRKKGSFLVQLYYGTDEDLLPDSVMIEFDIEHYSFPLKFFGREIEMDESKASSENSGKGKVYIYYSNYILNLGLGDEVFEEMEEE